MVHTNKKKVCLIASSGGHFEQIRMLRTLESKYDLYYVTESTQYSEKNKQTYYLKQVNRRELLFLITMIIIFIQSLVIFIKEKPDIIISTGAMSVIPTFFLGKVFGKKLIFIESFAKVNSPTLTGKLLYKFSDIFIVQWESLKKFYPKSIFFGSIY